MFNIGDRVVYPSQGIGVIDLIEEKEFNGKTENYYKIHLLNNRMNLTLPFSRVEPSKIRLVSDNNKIDDTLKNITRYTTCDDELDNSNFKGRMGVNAIKVKNGTLEDYLEVICNLSQVKSKYRLNSSEKDVLNNTKKFVVEEICQSMNIPQNEAIAMLDEAIDCFN